MVDDARDGNSLITSSYQDTSAIEANNLGDVSAGVQKESLRPQDKHTRKFSCTREERKK